MPEKHGKICYLILASTDPPKSAEFYASVFGWAIRGHDNGDLAFDDPTGGVSGMWDTSFTAREGGYEVDIWVQDVAATAAEIVAAGGSLIGELQHFGMTEQYQRFRDIDGNVLGLYNSGSGG
ncbi:MAG: VOC family protein [Thermomicrobiales bacterium]|nr:VOC family protein [Thermomicrobiales bacterium]MCO5228385.1 VOC family protein [Thermomicrobiales bacterium]